MNIAYSSQSTEHFLLAAKRAEIQGLKNLSSTCQVVSQVSDLIHQLQRERGLSNIYLASAGQRFHQQRLDQVNCTLNSESALRGLLEKSYLRGKKSDESPRLLSSIAFVLKGLDELSVLRSQVEKVEIAAPKLTDALCRLISGLLTVVFEAADGAGDPVVSRALVAQLHFMQGKEFSGQERAWAGTGFARGNFDVDLKEKLENIQLAQQRAFQIFQQFAEASQIELWTKIVANENTKELERLRTVIRRITKPEQISSSLSEIWYEVATRRIDDMQALESQMTENLLMLCSQEIKKAQLSLREHQCTLETLALTTRSQGPVPMLANVEAPINLWFGIPDGQGEGPGSIAANNPINKSVYDLLRDQAEHLKRINEDLNDARRALEERKLVEQAKGLLMKNLGLSEEMAYRKMQQKAMSSNLRLYEVSELLIAAANKTKS